MKRKHRYLRYFLALAVVASVATPSWSHCDSMDGPVIAQAKEALERKDISPTLKWIHPQDEPELRAAFAHTLSVRELGSEASALADRYFFETLVRIHRESEGAPYTGLRPAGGLEPVYREADSALEAGSAAALARHIGENVQSEIERRFAEAAELRRDAEDSPEGGRRYVAAYVRYMHFVEAAYGLVAHGAAHATSEGKSSGH